METPFSLKTALALIGCLLFLTGVSGLPASADTARTLTHEGNVFFREGDFESARRAYSEALAVDKSSVRALNNRGLALARQGKLAAALADLSKAAHLQPENGAIWNNRANVNCALNHVKEAVGDRMQALRLGRFTISQAQTGLRNSGFYRGPSDGIWGYDFDDALEKWTRAGCPKAPKDRLM